LAALPVEGCREPAVAPPGHLVMAKCPSCGGRIDGRGGMVIRGSLTASQCGCPLGDAPERVDVGSRTYFARIDRLLRGHEAGSPKVFQRLGHPWSTLLGGHMDEPPIRNRPSTGENEDVARGQVAVDQVFPVRVRDGRGDTKHPGAQMHPLLPREWAQLIQAALRLVGGVPAEVLIVLAHWEDVRVIQPAVDLDLLPHPPPRPVGRARDLNGNARPIAGVDGEVHIRLAAFLAASGIDGVPAEHHERRLPLAASPQPSGLDTRTLCNPAHLGETDHQPQPVLLPQLEHV
jgi:hypothetical protein